MKDTLRMVFPVMTVFGAVYLNNGKEKGPITLTYEISLVIIGILGMAIIGFRRQGEKSHDKEEAVPPNPAQPHVSDSPRRPTWMGDPADTRRRTIIILIVLGVIGVGAMVFLATQSR